MDRETNEHYPWLTLFRRRMLISVAAKIFVTDDLLVRKASEHLKVQATKIGVTCFGGVVPAAPETSTLNPVIRDAVRWIEQRKSAYPDPIVGLWVGTVAGKNIAGLYDLLRLAKRGKSENVPVLFMVIGPIDELQGTRHAALLSDLRQADNIFLHCKYSTIPVESWPLLADFVWKPLDDLSVSLTTYHAASARMPLVCCSNTFIGEMVEHYKLGFAVDVETVDMQELEARVRTWPKKNAIRFLEGHTWEKGARNLFSV
ncbi:glycosyltransferase [Thioalkalicoccus limnaeus]|uniref:Glycosyltransferase n=1 Tax=Thioalkalicoccus limnaeus TaxID=120681 RepID=A0ABV4BFR7_9GAMM